MKFLHFIKLSFILCLVFGYEYNVPSNFYGSPEVFSGFLSDQNEYIEAFTLKEDARIIEGNCTSVNEQLDSIETSGLYFLLR